MSGTATVYRIRYRVHGTTTWTDYGPTTALSEALIGLEPNTTYDLEVVADNGAGQTTSTIQTFTTAARAPSAATNLVATNVTPTSLTLTWAKSSTGSNPITYLLTYRVHGAGNFVNYGAPTSGTSINVTGLSPLTNYDFQVLAQNSVDNGPPSATLTIQTPSAGLPPTAPTNLALSNIQQNQVTLSWTASASGSPPITYQVQYRPTGTTTFNSFANTTSTTVAVTGLAANTSYDFQVTATNTIDTITSAIVSGKTLLPLAAPSAPGIPTATNITASSATVTSTASTSGATPISYQLVFRPTGTANFQNFGAPISASGTIVSQIVTGLQTATSYDFQYIATNSVASVASGTLTFSTLSANQTPSAPIGLGASNVTQTGLTLSWLPSTGTPTISYQAQSRATGATAWTNAGAATTGTSVSISGLALGTSYDFQVIASNGVGSATSAIFTTSTAAGTAPAAPTGLVATNITAGGLTLSWTASATGTQPITYQPQYRPTGGLTWTNAETTTTTSIGIRNLAPLTAYDLQVIASGPVNPAATSAILNITTAPQESASGTTLTANTGVIVDHSATQWRLA